MSAMASQITKLTVIYSTVYSGIDQMKQQSSAPLTFYAGNSPVADEFPAQRACNAENVSIWWRHHEYIMEYGLLDYNSFEAFTWKISY